ncbi:MAG: FMN-binding negative transcriptional regulator [Crocinitomicaceae bacterium]
MYVPDEFSVKDTAKIDAFIAANHFISLVTANGDFPIATHIPVLAKKVNEKWFLEGHLALANEQSKAILSCSNALCIVLGPDAYISSSLYSHENVPTWNYQSVHLSGKLSPLNDTELDHHLAEIVGFFEKTRENPLEFDHFSIEMMDSYKKEILGFQFETVKLEVAFKLSQNRNLVDQAAIVQDLQKCPFESAKRVADAMKNK